MRSNSPETVGITQIGLGPGGTAFWLAAERTGSVEALAQRGVIIFDESRLSNLGSGYLDVFPKVETNSAGRDLIQNMPQRLKDSILATDMGKAMSKEDSVSLARAARLQEAKAKYVRFLLGPNSIRTDTSVARIRQITQRGGPVFQTEDARGKTLSASETVILSTGAGEKTDPQLDTDSLRDKSFLSEDVLGNTKRSEEAREKLTSARKIIVVGASHSGGLVIEEALKHSDAAIDLIHRNGIAIHFKSTEEAREAGYPVTEEALNNDPDRKQPWRFRGARGQAKEILLGILNGSLSWVTGQKGTYEDFPAKLETADLIFQCTGLKWREVPLYVDESPVPYLVSNGKVSVDEEGRPYVIRGNLATPVEGLFHIGMGSTAEMQAINFYEGVVGKARVESVLEHIQARADRKSAVFS